MSEKAVRVFRSAVDGKYYKCAGLSSIEGNRRFEASGIVTPTDISEVQAVTILDEVLGLARPQYNLRNICRVISMDNLTMRVDVATALAGQRKVPPLVEAEISKESYTPVNFDLWKNVVHVALADEAQMKSAHALLGMHTSDAARDLVRMENLDIKDAAEACTEKVSSATYSDWGAQSSGVSTTDPFEAITAHINYIQGKGYPVDFMAMHPTLYSKFIRNTWVRELVKAGIAALGPAGGSFSLPGYPTVRIITDFALTETPTSSLGPLVGSSIAPAVAFGEGPTMAAQYRDEKAGYDGYVIRQWDQPKICIQDAISKICT